MKNIERNPTNKEHPYNGIRKLGLMRSHISLKIRQNIGINGQKNIESMWSTYEKDYKQQPMQDQKALQATERPMDAEEV